MDSVSVAEFRKNMKLMLDSALNDPVFIRRGDDIYQLSYKGDVFQFNINLKGYETARAEKEAEELATPKKIAGAAPILHEAMRQAGEAVSRYEDERVIKMVDEAQKNWREALPRTPQDVLKEIDTLKAELESEKAENELNQDPDYWADFNTRYKKIDDLWAEYHRLKGTA